MPKYFEIPQYKHKPSMEEMIAEVSDMSYKSPVETIWKGFQAQFEDNVMKAIQSYGINVDKDELIKALRYDRDQYRKGFVDGCIGRADKFKAEVAREIFEEIEERIAVRRFTSKSEDYADGCFDTIEWVDQKIDELKKKYTEDNNR